MKKRILSILTVLLLTMILTSTVSAGGNVGLSRVQFKLGSLIAEGFVKNTGNVDITVVLDAVGLPMITCINPDSEGENVPGHTKLKVSASGQQTLFGDSEGSGNNKRAFNVETVDPETIPWDVAGCPDSSWTAQVDFISWTKAKISVFDATSEGGSGLTALDSKEPPENNPLVWQSYGCRTRQERATVSCRPVSDHDDDDDDDDPDR